MVPASTWGVHAEGVACTGRLKLRREMAAKTGKKSTTSLSLFMEAYGLEVDVELSFHLGHSVLCRRSLDGKMVSRTKRSVDEANSRSSIVEEV